MKKHRYMHKYICFLRKHFNVPYIRVNIVWKASSLITENGECGFGLFMWPKEEGQIVEIYVAGKRIGKTGIMSVLAHEFAHYRQYLDDQNMDAEHIECEADLMGLEAMGKWLLQRRMNNNGQRYCSSRT